LPASVYGTTERAYYIRPVANATAIRQNGMAEDGDTFAIDGVVGTGGVLDDHF
jgi:hypothetical protein